MRFKKRRLRKEDDNWKEYGKWFVWFEGNGWWDDRREERKRKGWLTRDRNLKRKRSGGGGFLWFTSKSRQLMRKDDEKERNKWLEGREKKEELLNQPSNDSVGGKGWWMSGAIALRTFNVTRNASFHIVKIEWPALLHLFVR